MGSIVSNDIKEYRDTCTTKSKANVVSRAGTAIAITALLTVSFSNDCPEFTPNMNSTNTFQYMANKKIEKNSYRDRYQKIVNSDWFVNSYKDMSLGELLSID